MITFTPAELRELRGADKAAGETALTKQERELSRMLDNTDKPLTPRQLQNQTRCRRYYQNHRAQISQKKKAYYAANKSLCAASSQSYYKSHRAERAEYFKAYYQAKKERGQHAQADGFVQCHNAHQTTGSVKEGNR